MQEIKSTYVTLEQAKLLKEKGFNQNPYIILKCYAPEYINGDGVRLKSSLCAPEYNIATAPEQWQVVEWLRVNHGIWIEIHHIKTTDNKFHIIIWKYGEQDYHTLYCENLIGYKVWDTPQEAYSAAFDYILKELI